MSTIGGRPIGIFCRMFPSNERMVLGLPLITLGHTIFAAFGQSPEYSVNFLFIWRLLPLWTPTQAITANETVYPGGRSKLIKIFDLKRTRIFMSYLEH